jgi:Lipase (class 3)
MSASLSCLVLVTVLVLCAAVPGEAAASPGNRMGNPNPPPDVHDQLAYLMYAYASFCYDGLANWTCFWCHHVPWVKGVRVVHVVDSGGPSGIYGYVGVTQEVNSSLPMIVVSFRGTSSTQNWETDLELWENRFPEAPAAKIHHGFYTAWLSVRDQVRATASAWY